MAHFQLLLTDWKNENFKKLVRTLDDEYEEQFGEIALKYRPYHSLEDIQTAVVAFCDRLPVGCGGFRGYRQDTVEIKRMFVRKDYRRRGIAEGIIEKLEEEAVKKGYRRAVLETGVEMEPAIRLYQKLHYHVIPNFDQYENDEICLCMEKELL